MNAGVPRRTFSCVTIDSGDAECVDLHDPEVEHLDEIVLAAVSAHQDVRGLDVAVHQSVRFGFGERMTDLTKQKDRTFGRTPDRAA